MIFIKEWEAKGDYGVDMSQKLTERTIDARTLPPKEKHPTIFKTWNSLGAGESLLLVNDHDPLPLYFQLSCEHTGQFHWEYVEQGPELWRVRLRKGDFADPGFVPPKKERPAVAVGGKRVAPLVLDTRPIFERGETPCGQIDESLAALKGNQKLVLVVPFEPVPLYAKLGREGFAHKTEQMADGSWRVEFHRTA